MKIRSLGVLSLVIAGIFITPISTATAQEVQERIIRFGHLNNADHPISFGVKKSAELVAAKSGGKIQVKEFPSNQLGTEQQQTQALRAGTQEMQSPATTSLVGLAKDLGVIDFPFAVSTYPQGFALVDGPSEMRCSRSYRKKDWSVLVIGILVSGMRPTVNVRSPNLKISMD